MIKKTHYLHAIPRFSQCIHPAMQTCACYLFHYNTTYLNHPGSSVSARHNISLDLYPFIDSLLDNHSTSFPCTGRIGDRNREGEINISMVLFGRFYNKLSIYFRVRSAIDFFLFSFGLSLLTVSKNWILSNRLASLNLSQL